VRLRHLARRLHQLGERPIFEFLLELDAGADLQDALERYAAINVYGDFIRAYDGDRLPSLLPTVGGRR
jgi:hypothetical protein